MQLDTYQAKVLTFLFEKLPIGDDVETLEFSLTGEFTGKFRIAHSAIDGAGQAFTGVFSLPTYSQSVFLALARTNVADTARILANLEDYERGAAVQLGLGEVVVTPEQARDVAAPYAVILLRTATSPEYERVPDVWTVGDRRTSFFLVVPLTKDEWELRRARGHDALMDHFQDDEKELFF